MKDKCEMNPQLDRKADILKFATRLFADFGFSGVSIRKISEVCGCNPAAISYYFGGKDKLYEACLRTLDPEAIKEFDSILKEPSDKEEFETTFLQLCTFLCTFVQQNGEAVKLVINEINSNSKIKLDKENTFLSPILSKLEKFIKESIEKKIVDEEVDPCLMTSMIFSSVVSQIVFENFKSFEQISNKEFAEKIVRNCTGSFYV